MKKSKSENKIENNSGKIIFENIETSIKVKRAKHRLRVLKRVYPRIFNFNFPSDKRHFTKPTYKTLENQYKDLSVRLSSKNKETESTSAERHFHELLKQKINTPIKPTFWIGSHCIDLLLPFIRSEKKHPFKVMRGLAFELDGDCHKWEQKGIKDERKGEQLRQLGISVVHIPNWAFSEETVQLILKSLSGFKQIKDSRERQRMWTRVYAYTLAIHLRDKEFFQIFKHKPKTVGGTHGK